MNETFTIKKKIIGKKCNRLSLCRLMRMRHLHPWLHPQHPQVSAPSLHYFCLCWEVVSKPTKGKQELN